MHWYVFSISGIGPQIDTDKLIWPCIKFSECQCYLNGTIDESNVCEKSDVSNGSCHSQPGCKYGYNGHDCGKCDSELGYGYDTNGNCDTCIDNFFVASYDSDGRPKCQGKHNKCEHLLGSKLAYCT